MQTNIFSVAGQAAQLRRNMLYKKRKNAISARFDGVPAKRIGGKQFPKKADYILHRDCIDGLHRTGFKFIIFSGVDVRFCVDAFGSS